MTASKVIAPIRVSVGELERRWRAVREQMKARKLDFLLIQNNVGILSGDIKWFADMRCDDGYPVTIIFPQKDEMTIISHGPRAAAAPPRPGEYAPGVKSKITVPCIQTLTPTNIVTAEEIVGQLAPYKNIRIGLVGMGFFSASIYKYVTDNLPTAKFEEADDWVDVLKALKSEEEIEFTRQSCALHEAIFKYTLKHVKIGMRVRDLRVDLIHKARKLGANYINIGLGAAPAGRGSPVMADREEVIDDGYQLSFFFETDGPSGYWGELSRTICIGKASEALKEDFDMACQAQRLAAKLLKPGARPADVWNAFNQFMRKNGYAEEKRIFAHGQGYDMVDRPSIDLYETIPVQAGMNLAIHPSLFSSKAFGWVCDNYIIRENGENERLHKVEQKLFVI